MDIGVDIGGTKILAVAIDGESTSPVAVRRRPTPTGEHAMTDAIVAVVDEIERAVGGRARGVGIGIAGLVDRSGTMRYGPNLPGIVDYPVAAAVGERLGRVVVVDNDATAATWAEHRCGAGVGVDDLVMVSLGTGIGTGFVLGGRLYRGHRGYAGESGHMVIDRNGARYHTGARGPWEMYASGNGLGDRLEAEGLGHLVAPADFESAIAEITASSERLLEGLEIRGASR